MEEREAATVRVLRTISAHVRKNIGKIDHVFHPTDEPKLIHIDIFHVLPTDERPFHTLVTCGMSSRPMCAPMEAPTLRRIELYLCLQPQWFGPPEAPEGCMWPVHELNDLAYMPHLRESWLWHAHTVSGPDHSEPIAPGVKFTGWVIGGPSILTRAGCRVRLGRENVYLMSAVPIYEEELEYALRRGSHALFARMEEAGVTPVIDRNRRNCVTGRRPRG